MSAIIELDIVPDSMLLIGNSPLGGYNGLRYTYFELQNIVIISEYFYSSNNVNTTDVSLTKELTSDNKFKITLTSKPLGYYRLYGSYDLYY